MTRRAAALAEEGGDRGRAARPVGSLLPSAPPRRASPLLSPTMPRPSDPSSRSSGKAKAKAVVEVAQGIPNEPDFNEQLLRQYYGPTTATATTAATATATAPPACRQRSSEQTRT